MNTSTTTTMAFKVKTTAPKLFAVRPNYGKLGPGESSEIYIAFQVTDSNKQARDDQSFDTKRKDKFLVQSIVIPEMNDQQFQEQMGDLWEQAKQLKAASAENPTGLTEKMLKCTYSIDDDSQEAATTLDRNTNSLVTERSEKNGILFLLAEPKSKGSNQDLKAKHPSVGDQLKHMQLGLPGAFPGDSNSNRTMSANRSIIGFGIFQHTKLMDQLKQQFGVVLDKCRNLRSKCQTISLNAQLPIEFPKIVIVGCESAGKSSLIERLAGFRVFPVGEDLTTRMPIAMNLKTASEQLLKDICVQHNLFYYPGNPLPIVGIRPYNSNNLQYFIGPYAGNRIQQEMEKYIRSVNNGQLSGIWDQEFVIEVLHPRVPNLQLVDLPGVVSATRTGEPPSLPEQTLNLSRRYVSDPFSLIIAVIPCMEYIVNNRIVGLIQECGAINRSLCVLTKIDITRPQDVVSRVSGISPDAESFRTNGYIGISNSEFHPNRSFEDICAAEAALCQILANLRVNKL